MAKLPIKEAAIMLALIASVFGGLTIEEIYNSPVLEQTGGRISLFDVMMDLSGMNYTKAQVDNYVYYNVTADTWRICFEHPSPSQTAYVAGNSANDPYIKTTINASNPVLFKKSTSGRTVWLNLDMLGRGANKVPFYRDVEVVGFELEVPGRGNTWRQITNDDCLERKTTKSINRFRIPVELNKKNYVVNSSRLDSNCYHLVRECGYDNCTFNITQHEAMLSSREPPEDWSC